MQTLKRWWPTILPLLIAIFTALLPLLQGLIARHPVAATVLAGIGWIVAHLRQSPLQGAK